MKNFNFLQRLFDVQPNDSPFASIYLNTEPNENGKKDFETFLKKQLNDHVEVHPTGSDERGRLENVADSIRLAVDDFSDSTRGAAMFARSDGFLTTFEFAVPFDESKFYLFDRPFVFPLVRLMDRNPTFAIVAADTNKAHILVFKRAEEIRREDIENTKTNRSEVGGWSQMRFQRHVENFHQQHAKEVVEALDKIVSEARIEYVVLVGDQTGVVPLLKDEMSDELSSKIVASLSLNVNTPDHELEQAGRDAVSEFLRKADKEKIEQLREVNYDGGSGVAGVDKTLAALLNGQVQELYLSADPDHIAFRRPDVEAILKDYEPGLDEGPDLNLRDKELLIDELIRLATSSADSVRFIDDEHLLKQDGGVGALLRYQAKGVTGT